MPGTVVFRTPILPALDDLVRVMESLPPMSGAETRISMRRRNRYLGYVALGLLTAYAIVAVSPIKAVIARRDPALASWFYPILFNFSEEYESGRVLEFRVGMPRAEFFKVLKASYVGRGTIIVNCEVITGHSLVPITSALDIEAAYGGGDRLCVSPDFDGPGVTARFRDEKISSIEIWYVSNEMP
jgi:hypothetical protein